MSTLVVDTLTGKSTATTLTIGSTPVVSASANSLTIRGEGSNQTSIQQGLAKSWINFEGDGTIEISDSLNVTSISDRNTGAYTVNIANDMANAIYSVTASGTHDAGSYVVQTVISHDTGLAAGSCPVDCLNNSSSQVDSELVCVTLHGDLA